jgi:hypothetical protein
MKYAFRSFFPILTRGEVPEDVARELVKPPQLGSGPAAAAAPAKQEEAPIDRAVQALALLQRDGRLIDFLSEDITPYPDAQLGAAVRSVHESCRQVLDKYFKLEPVLDSEEDQPVTVQPGFDATAIKLIGNVTGTPPIRGVLRHRGWRVKEASLPALPQGSGRMVVAPAEVEIP